jgi:hypothetical protein
VAPPQSRARLAFTAVFLFAALFWAYDLAGLHAGVPDPLDDTWDYGVVARHLLAGDGFRTSAIHPPLWGLRDAALTVPVLIHGPLLPLLFAPALALAGPGILDEVAWLAALFAFLTALLLFRVGRRAFGPAVGAAAALLFTLAPLTVRAVHHDVSLLVGAFLLLLVFDLLARDRPHHTAAAVVLGLGLLTRPELALALPGLAMLAGGTGTVVLLLGAAIIGAPWAWHNLRFGGSPFFNLSGYLLVGYSEQWRGISVLRDFGLTPARWPAVLVEQSAWLPDKALVNLPHALKRALMTPSGLTGWLAALGVIVGVARAAVRWVVVAALVCALVPLAVMSLTLYDSRYLVPFLPLWALSAAVAAEWLWDQLPRVGGTRLWIAALALLMLPATVPTLMQQTREARALEVRLAAERAALAPRVTHAAALPRLTPLGLEAPADSLHQKPRLMFSDTPDFVAWSTGRPTLWMTQAEYERLPAAPAPATSPPTRGGAKQKKGAVKIAVETTAAAPDTLPFRGGPDDVWFHSGAR